MVIKAQGLANRINQTLRKRVKKKKKVCSHSDSVAFKISFIRATEIDGYYSSCQKEAWLIEVALFIKYPYGPDINMFLRFKGN